MVIRLFILPSEEESSKILERARMIFFSAKLKTSALKKFQSD